MGLMTGLFFLRAVVVFAFVLVFLTRIKLTQQGRRNKDGAGGQLAPPLFAPTIEGKTSSLTDLLLKSIGPYKF